MKSYNDFIGESYAARENLDEAFGLRTLGKLAWSAAKNTLGSDRGRRVVGAIGAYQSGKNVVKGDKAERNKGHMGSLATGAAAYLNKPTILYRQHAANKIGAEQIGKSYLISRLSNIIEIWKRNKKTYQMMKCMGKDYSILKLLYYKLTTSLSKLHGITL